MQCSIRKTETKKNSAILNVKTKQISDNNSLNNCSKAMSYSIYLGLCTAFLNTYQRCYEKTMGILIKNVEYEMENLPIRINTVNKYTFS